MVAIFSGFGSSLPPHQLYIIIKKMKKKKKKKKNVVKVGPPLTKFSGSAHDVEQHNTARYTLSHRALGHTIKTPFRIYVLRK